MDAEDDLMEEEEQEINAEDAWSVITSYFDEKGLVRQQLDSFDEFIQNTMQEIVGEYGDHGSHYFRRYFSIRQVIAPTIVSQDRPKQSNCVLESQVELLNLLCAHEVTCPVGVVCFTIVSLKALRPKSRGHSLAGFPFAHTL